MSQDRTSEVVAALVDLAARQDLRRRAEEGCRGWLATAEEEGDLNGLAVAAIELHFARCALVFDHGILTEPFVETRFDLCIREPRGYWFRDLRPIGHYRLITDLDGAAVDDYFVLDSAIDHSR